MLARWFLAVSPRNIFQLRNGRRQSFSFPETVIWEAWWPCFGTLGTFWHPGRPLEQQEGHMGIWNRMFRGFGNESGSHLECFPNTESQTSGFVFGFVSIRVRYRFLLRDWTCGALKTEFWYNEYCKNQLVTEPFLGIFC